MSSAQEGTGTRSGPALEALVRERVETSRPKRTQIPRGPHLRKAICFCRSFDLLLEPTLLGSKMPLKHLGPAAVLHPGLKASEIRLVVELLGEFLLGAQC